MVKVNSKVKKGTENPSGEGEGKVEAKINPTISALKGHKYSKSKTDLITPTNQTSKKNPKRKEKEATARLPRTINTLTNQNHALHCMHLTSHYH